MRRIFHAHQNATRSGDSPAEIEDFWCANESLRDSSMPSSSLLRAILSAGPRYCVGELKWKGPQEYRSIKYSQSGFELNNTSGRTVLTLSKIGDIQLVYHREIPDDATIKEVIVKQDPTGEWFGILGIETENDAPLKPETPEACVGIDVGILKYAHDSDGIAVDRPDLSEEREQLEREQRKLSRKEHGSANYRKQQQIVAQRHADLKRKRRDFLHKLSNYTGRRKR